MHSTQAAPPSGVIILLAHSSEPLLPLLQRAQATNVQVDASLTKPKCRGVVPVPVPMQLVTGPGEEDAAEKH